MSKPSLTFFCELDSQALLNLFSSRQVIKDLKRLDANLSLGLLDLSPQRAEVVKKLNRAGVPVTAWILLPKEQGYWTSLDTIHETRQRYLEFRAWKTFHKLEFAAIGLDIEPRLDTMAGFGRQPASQIARLIKRLVYSPRFSENLSEARYLIRSMQADGFAVETYQFPTVIDERAVHSNVLSKTLGIPPLDSDREVLMLYSSFFSVYPDSILWSYAKQCTAVGVGSTGGGVEIDGVAPLKTLRWIDLKRDLLLASKTVPHVYIFSLEGCVERKFLERLADLDWNTAIIPPERHALGISLVRKLGQGVLWVLTNPVEILLGILLANKLSKWLERSSKRN